MELKIKEIKFPEVINFNFEELKKEITGKVEMYKNLVYTDEQIKEAKADKAQLNKFVKALSDERIKVKKQCLQPYEEFEKKIKELSAIVNEPISLIDKQVKEFEEKQKQEKLDNIKTFFTSCIHPDWLTFEQIFEEKWLNVSVSMKLIQSDIDSLMGQIEKDMNTLFKLPEFGFEAQQVYISTLDINKAISEGHRLSEIQKKKAEHEAEQARLKAEAESRKVDAPESQIGQAIEPIERPAFENCMNPPVEEDYMWIAFKACLTVSQATELKVFFETRNIEFKAI